MKKNNLGRPKQKDKRKTFSNNEAIIFLYIKKI